MLLIHKVKSLPKLAWALMRHYGGDCDDFALIGDGMRQEGKAVYEGGYTGSTLDDSEIFMGSGFLEDGETLNIYTPSHVFDFCFILHDKENKSFIASNSIFFLIALSNTGEDYKIWDFKKAFYGLGKFNYAIYNSPRYDVYMVCAATARIVKSDINFTRHRYHYSFNTFEEYHEFIKDVLFKRDRSFNSDGISVYLSRGYDSACCAVLDNEVFPGKQRQALTMVLGRNNLDDHGGELARKLGMKVRLIDSMAECNTLHAEPALRYKIGKRYFNVASLFASPINKYCEHTYWVDTSILDNQMVLSGNHGDILWNYDDPNDDMDRMAHQDLTGSGIAEFRLTSGFMYVPVPAIAYSSWESLSRIAKSQEMLPWRVNQPGYDRPIPRRIVEEFSSIKRGEFATHKNMIAGFAHFLDNSSKSVGIEELYSIRIKYYQDLISIAKYELDIYSHASSSFVNVNPYDSIFSKYIESKLCILAQSDNKRLRDYLIRLCLRKHELEDSLRVFLARPDKLDLWKDFEVIFKDIVSEASLAKSVIQRELFVISLSEFIEILVGKYEWGWEIYFKIASTILHSSLCEDARIEGAILSSALRRVASGSPCAYGFFLLGIAAYRHSLFEASAHLFKQVYSIDPNLSLPSFPGYEQGSDFYEFVTIAKRESTPPPSVYNIHISYVSFIIYSLSFQTVGQRQGKFFFSLWPNKFIFYGRYSVWEVTTS